MGFADLHQPGNPLILPNAWDFASGALFAAHGFVAIGTTSLGVAAVHGKPDAAGATKEETVELARRIVALDVMVTVDLENGFSDEPAEVGEFVAFLAELGVAGVNIEDGRADGTLRDIDRQCAILGAARGHGVFVNARTDTHWLGVGDTGDTLQRVRAYQEVADGIFVPGVSDLATIESIVTNTRRPLNVLAGPSVAALARVGVARISTGSLLYRTALHAGLAKAVDLRGDPNSPELPTYQHLAEILRAAGASA